MKISIKIAKKVGRWIGRYVAFISLFFRRPLAAVAIGDPNLGPTVARGGVFRLGEPQGIRHKTGHKELLHVDLGPGNVDGNDGETTSNDNATRPREGGTSEVQPAGGSKRAPASESRPQFHPHLRGGLNQPNWLSGPPP
jgi:hypothetical protein